MEPADDGPAVPEATPEPSRLEPFDLELAAGAKPGSYTSDVLRSPVGESDGTAHSDFEVTEAFFAEAQDASNHLPSMTDFEAMSGLGSDLFKLAFRGATEQLYRRSLDVARTNKQPLQIRLRVKDPKLAQLPWEALRDPTEGRHIALGTDSPIVRYIPHSQSVPTIAAELPLNILALTAEPSTVAPLDTDKELSDIEDALKKHRADRTVSVFRTDGRLTDLQAMLDSGTGMHVLHLVAHGGFNDQSESGMLALVKEDSSVDFVSASKFAHVVRDHPALQLVVLNACQTGVSSAETGLNGIAHELIRQGVAAVVAMQAAITDDASIEFSEAFYRSLTRGDTIELAVTSGRKALLNGSFGAQWITPVLFTRSPSARLLEPRER